jgi:hypothetical protein
MHCNATVFDFFRRDGQNPQAQRTFSTPFRHIPFKSL